MMGEDLITKCKMTGGHHGVLSKSIKLDGVVA